MSATTPDAGVMLDALRALGNAGRSVLRAETHRALAEQALDEGDSAAFDIHVHRAMAALQDAALRLHLCPKLAPPLSGSGT